MLFLNSDKTDEPTAKILGNEPDDFPEQMFDCKFISSMSELDIRFKVYNSHILNLYNKKVLVNLEAGKTHNYSKKVVSHCAVRSCVGIEHYRSQHMKLLEKCFLMKIPFSLASLNEAEKCPTPVTALHISSLSLGKLFKVSYIGDVKICYESGHENLTANPMLKS